MNSYSEHGASTRSTSDSNSVTSTHYRTLDHWRGLACLLIVIHHALLPLCDYGTPESISSVTETTLRPSSVGTLPASAKPLRTSATGARPSQLRNWLVARLRVGVQLFFVISGYCIAATAYSLAKQGGSIKTYFRRRLMRIFPAYWCALLGSVLLCYLIDYSNAGVLQQVPWPLAMPWDLTAMQWIGSITLTETWTSYFSQHSPASFPIQVWTLCYEVQFYAVFGLLLGCSGHRVLRAIAIFTIVVAAIDVLLLCYKVRIRGLFIDEHWFMFAAGIGLFWDLNKATSGQALWGRMIVALATIILSILASTTTIFGISSQFSAWRIIEAVAFAALLLCLKRYDERIARISGLNWLKSCGVMCYSIYLTHLFPGKLLSQQLISAGFSDDVSIVLICIPLALSMSISLGYIFHALVERRFLTVPMRRHAPFPASVESHEKLFPITSADERLQPDEIAPVQSHVRRNIDRAA